MPRLDILTDYHPENKTQLLNFMDVLNLCKGYEQIEQNIMGHNSSRTSITSPLCRQKGICNKTKQCHRCCENSKEHLHGIYKDIEVLKKLAKEYQSQFIKELFGEGFILPDVPIRIIASFMNEQQLPLPSRMGPNSFPYIFETNKKLSSMYDKYSRIFTLLQYACNPSRKISREILDETFQNLSYSQIVCGCNKIRWPLEEKPTFSSCQINAGKPSNTVTSK